MFKSVAQNATVVLLVLVVMGLSPASARGDDLLTYYYAQTSWPTIHRDSCNSNYVPFTGPDSLVTNWTALDGTRILTATTIGPEGNLYKTTGKGSKRFHLYALDQENGGTIWKTNLLDIQAVVSAVVVDIDGHIYVSDSEELFAFYSNGALKWSTPISGCVYTTAITIDGYLVAITEDGEVMAINRGDGTLAAGILYLAPLPEGRVINTPAIHPETNRIYIVTGDAGVEDGYFYGIDFDSGAGSLGIAFETQMGPHSASSPTISYDGSHIYVADRGEFLYAFNEDGSLAWTYPLSGPCLGSPSIGPGGEIYFLEGGKVTAIRDLGANAEFLWDTISIQDTLAAQLPDYGYTRVARANSVVTVTTNYLYVVVTSGYLFPYRRKDYLIPHRTVLCTMDPGDGYIIGTVELRDVCEGAAIVASNGSIYVSHGSITSSIAYRLNRVLPPELRVPKPPGGITALRPTSYLTLANNSINSGKKNSQKVLSLMEGGEIDEAIALIVQVEEQLRATSSAIDSAETQYEIDSKTAKQARECVETAYTLIGNAKKSLDDGKATSAMQLIENADNELEKALSIIIGK